MAKKPKKPVAAKLTASKMGYKIAIDALREAHEEYAEGTADDDTFTSPGKQKKVAVQVAKFHNRLLKKSKLPGDELDEELD